MSTLTRGKVSWVMAWGLIASCAVAKPAIHEPDKSNDLEVEATKAALAILKQADDAAKAVKLIRYDAKWEGTGWAKSRTWKLDGTVIAGKGSDETPQVFLIVLAAQAPLQSEARDYTSGFDGTTYFMIDTKRELVYEGTNGPAMGQGGRVAQALAHCGAGPTSERSA